jgi:hypothetical protein
MKKVALLPLMVCILGVISPARAVDSSRGFAFTDKVVLAYYRGTFEATMSSDPDWLHISTFSELAEFSHIEATFEHGYKYNLMAQFVREFKSPRETGEVRSENRR